jgi:subtilisin family serine protease
MKLMNRGKVAFTLCAIAVVALAVSAQSTTQPNAPWHLDRIDQRDLPLSGTYTWGNDGSGVTVYVIDNGVRISHTQFGGRASAGPTFVTEPDPGEPPIFVPKVLPATDPDHGTMVASLVGGSKFGVAKGVHIVSVAVMGSSGHGRLTDIAAGIQWVVDNHQGPSVINISISERVSALGGLEALTEQAIQNALNAGITVVGIAGNNGGIDASLVSPGRVSGIITVGATDENDERASFSNVGASVDLFAPGVNITGAGASGDTAEVTSTVGGTSLAAPIVAGIAARYLQAHPSASPSEVSSAIVGSATADRLVAGTLGAGSPNLLVFADPLDDPTDPPTGRRRLNANGVCYFEPNENGPNLCDFPAPGRYKLDGNGGCYWDPNDSGPAQCEPHAGRWKSDGSGGCYWEPNDDPPDQCDPNAHQGRWKSDGNGGCYWDPNDDPPDQCQPSEPRTPMAEAGGSGIAGLAAYAWRKRRRRRAR